MNTIAMLSVIIGIVSAVVIALDVARYSQSMKIMNIVWVLTALWSGIFGLIAYFWFGRLKKENVGTMTAADEKMGEKMPMDEMAGMPNMDMGSITEMKSKTMVQMSSMPMPMPMEMGQTSTIKMMRQRPKWQAITLSTLHCGAGCTLADIAGEWLLYLTAITIGGSLFLSSVVVDYILALIIGVYFQYAAIKSMSKLPTNKIIAKAFKADVLSLTAWQIGMYGFMAIAIFVIFPLQTLPKDSWMFWFMMQIAMFFGFLFSFPINLLLIKVKIKTSM